MIVGGLLSIVVFSVTFGLSTNFTFAILSRCVKSLVSPFVVLRRFGEQSQGRFPPPSFAAQGGCATSGTAYSFTHVSKTLDTACNGPRARCQPHCQCLSRRFILGLTNGISPALRTTLREACGHEHVLQGMTYFSGENCYMRNLVLHLPTLNNIHAETQFLKHCLGMFPQRCFWLSVYTLF